MAKAVEFQTLFTDRAVPTGLTTFTSELPSGARDSKGLVGVHLMLHATVVPGTGATPNTIAASQCVENVTLRLSRDGVIYSLPGVALLLRNNVLSFGGGSFSDVFTGSAGTYSFHIPLLFVDRRTVVPEDTVLDLRRNSSMQIDLTLGGPSRWFTTPGTATVTYTMDCEIETYDRPLSEENPQKWSLYVVHKQSVTVPTNKILIEQAPGLWIKRLLWTTSSSADPWQGVLHSYTTPAVKRWSIEDIDGSVGLRGVPDKLLSVRRHCDYGILSDVRVIDYISRSGSLRDATTANRTGYALTWEPIASPPAGENVHLLLDGFKLLT